MNNDTIIAAATFPAESAIGVVRVSGSKTFQELEKMFAFRDSAKNFANVSSHTLSLGTISSANTPIDEVLLAVFKSPSSYTGEDMAEINCHGNPLIINSILSGLMALGCRLAEPGEFTRRAFLNGKMDLSQAEAVADVTSACNVTALNLSLEQLKGREKEIINSLRSDVTSALSKLEAEIDFSHENNGSLEPANFKTILASILVKMDRLLANARAGIKMKEGYTAAITGRPNSGKSSLLNLLLKKERAIVTHTPGTTRDTIEGSAVIDGVPFKIIDTAGVRRTEDPAEKEGIRRAAAEIASSDAVIFLMDGSLPLSEEDSLAFEAAKGKKIIPVINKSDLSASTGPAETAVKFGFEQGSILRVSALKNSGMDGLRSALKASAGAPAPAGAGDMTVSSSRHALCLSSAKSCVEKALAAPAPETAAADLREAAGFLASITGEISTEKVLDDIFKNFCVGK